VIITRHAASRVDLARKRNVAPQLVQVPQALEEHLRLAVSAVEDHRALTSSITASSL
jgi:hypothetical protein